MAKVSITGITVDGNGDTWSEAFEEARKQATEHQQMVRLKFRGVDLIIHASDDSDSMWVDYSALASQQRRRASWDGSRG